MSHILFIAVDGVLNSEYYFSVQGFTDAQPFASGDVDPAVIPLLNLLRAEIIKGSAGTVGTANIVFLPSWRTVPLRTVQRRLADFGLKWPIGNILKGDKVEAIQKYITTDTKFVIVDSTGTSYPAELAPKVVRVSKHWGLTAAHVGQIVTAYGV